MNSVYISRAKLGNLELVTAKNNKKSVLVCVGVHV